MLLLKRNFHQHRTHLAEREAAEQDRDTASNRLAEMTSRLTSYLYVDGIDSSHSGSTEILIQQVGYCVSISRLGSSILNVPDTKY